MASYAYDSGNLSLPGQGEAWSVRVDSKGQRFLVVETPRHAVVRQSEVGETKNAASSRGAHQHNGDVMSEIAWLKAQVRMLSNVVGTGNVRSELNDLHQMFTEWKGARTPSGREQMARRIRSRFVQRKVLFCSDMSGFSRICKAEGILHFLSLLKTMQSIMIPILQSHGGELIKVSADNLFVVFDSPEQAVEASWECMAAAATYSAGKDKNNSIKISIGLAQGDMWIVRGVDVFGDAANLSFELGENMASKEIFIDERVAQAVQSDSRYRLEWRQDEIIGQSTQYAKITLRGSLPNITIAQVNPPIVNPPINSEEPDDFVRMIELRQLATSIQERQSVDKMMEQRFIKTRAVLVIEMYQQAEVAHEHGILNYIEMVLSMKRACSAAVKHWHGKSVRSIESKVIGQCLALFESPAAAIKAAIESRYRLRDQVFELAIGVGFSEILDLDACNAFGDAVNMAFKLGEDVAVGGEILVTSNVHSDVSRNPDLQFDMTDSRLVELSGVKISHFNVAYDDWRAEEMVEASEQRRSSSPGRSRPAKGKRMSSHGN